MKWKRWIWLALLGLMCGCSREDADRIGLIGQKAAGKLEGLSGGPRGKMSCGLQALRASLSDATLDSRVCVRLRWDKLISDANIHVRLVSAGVIQLEGTATEVMRRRAVEIAESTKGVEQVVEAFDQP
jgi:osmotically-inducible protein OsmY